MGLLDGKTGVIYGVANHRSIAWGIAQAAAREGARLAITYQDERLEKAVQELTSQLPDSFTIRCDVESDQEIEDVYQSVERRYGGLDFVVHSVAFAPRQELAGRFAETSREGFKTALSISAYSLIAVTRPALRLMGPGGSVVTMTYSSNRVYPGYNVMGPAKAALESIVRYLAHDLGERSIRVNAISAGPTDTTAARGIPKFTQMRSMSRERAPLGRNTDISDIGEAALFLLSDLAKAVTGEVLFVDCGENIMGV